MSSLSSSLNALASSTTYDLIRPLSKSAWDDEKGLSISRLATLFWGVLLTGSAFLFTLLQLSGEDRPALVELGLGIASYTYSGVLGVLLMRGWFQQPDYKD